MTCFSANSMFLATLFLSSCAAVLAAPQFAQINNVQQNHQMANMFKALDVESMIKTFDPKVLNFCYMCIYCKMFTGEHFVNIKNNFMVLPL